MDTFEGKAAVITGGASGMGRAMADRFGAAGARLMIADVEGPALDAAVAELSDAGVDAVGVLTDVSSEGDMDDLAEQALSRFGQVNVVCNNAGVGSGAPMETLTTADWKWILDVNLWGVIHGIRVFLPHLLEHGDGHIVNTGSVAGHTSYPNIGPYNASKHAVVSISETLYNELQERGSSVGVSVLCPGLVSTNIINSERNRPESLRSPIIPPDPTPEDEERRQFMLGLYEQAVKPPEVAELVYRAVLDNQFYIWTDYVYAEAIQQRHEDIRLGRNPSRRSQLVEEDQSVKAPPSSG
ncbi:SDR family NAD(P)-dependent oxidoreductase [Candidatus Poriferisocius sp.]|uniref:SDR family NAD(P)-dependent oxidoreductase n=1 Tax=Candidatus Poriferisocius sp. TaxID=3101276 RepID=UPI003B5C85F7